jgi:hypothetical protein
VNKKRTPGAGDAGGPDEATKVASSPHLSNRPGLFKIAIDHVVTADMDDGQPLPPFIEDGVVWCVVRRQHGRTLWRRITLQATNQSVAVTLDGGLHSPSVKREE